MKTFKIEKYKVKVVENKEKIEKEQEKEERRKKRTKEGLPNFSRSIIILITYCFLLKYNKFSK